MKRKLRRLAGWADLEWHASCSQRLPCALIHPLPPRAGHLRQNAFYIPGHALWASSSASCIGGGRCVSAPFPPFYGMPSAILPHSPSTQPQPSSLWGVILNISLEHPFPFTSHRLGFRRIATPLRTPHDPKPTSHPLTTSRPQNTQWFSRLSYGSHLSRL